MLAGTTPVEELITQEGWLYKYAWSAKHSSMASESGLPVASDENFKAKTINLMSFARPHMRAFHYSWISFFLAFLCWFAFAPLMPTIRVELGLNMKQVLTINMMSVACTIFARFALGPLCEQYGPKRLQTYLLAWISVMCFLAPTVNSFAGLLLLRMCIGIGGGTFVVTQYWSSQMFTKDIVGVANATTGGWGNLGGGVTQVLMVAVFEGIRSSGVGPAGAWRLAMLVPAAMVGLFAIIMRASSDDSPQVRVRTRLDPSRTPHLPASRSNSRSSFCQQGDYIPLMKAGVIEKKEAKAVARDGFFNPNSWFLGLQYATSFGVELHMNNLAALYFYNNFGVSQFTAGNLASVFGAMNLCCRSLGGAASDKAMARCGMQGRLLVQTGGLVLEGAMIIVFSKCTVLATAMPVLVVFSALVQATEGTTFGIVPYVDPPNLGAVCGVVGAWGNIGAVLWSWLFREFFSDQLDKGFGVLGFFVIVSALASGFVRIPGHSTLFSSAPHTPASAVAAEALARISKLEERMDAIAPATKGSESVVTTTVEVVRSTN